jgi:hypothetical protein
MCAGIAPEAVTCVEEADTQNPMRMTSCRQKMVGHKCRVAVRSRAWQNRRRRGSSAAAEKQKWWTQVRRRPQFVSLHLEMGGGVV